MQQQERNQVQPKKSEGARKKARRNARRNGEEERNEEEKEKLVDRLLEGRRKGAAQGRHQSGTTPFGYYRDYQSEEEGVPLRVHPEESRVVKLIFKKYLQFKSMKAVTDWLNERDHTTRRGKKWSRAGISWILKNDTYIGNVHFGDIRAPGRHRALISKTTFEKVRKLIKKNNKRSS